MVDALELLSVEVILQLVGSFKDLNLRERVKRKSGWKKVRERGVLERRGVGEILATSTAGLVLFLPAPNHVDSQPNKMFEYMSAGVPVIASNFPLWREIIEKNKCGLCVDPTDPKEIAGAITHFVNNPNVAKEMGKNGQRAIEKKYNWKVEEAKLLSLYENLISKNVPQ